MKYELGHLETSKSTQVFRNMSYKCLIDQEQMFYIWLDILACMSRIVAFTGKNIDTKILFAYLLGWLNYSTVEIPKKIMAQNREHCTDIKIPLELHKNGMRTCQNA